MKRIEFSEEVVKNILILNEEGKGYRKIAKILNISETAVLRLLRERNVQKPFKAPRLHSLDETYFEQIDDEHKAYWLGLLYADGNISKNTIKLIQKPDGSGVKILEFFKKDTKSDYNIVTRTQDSWGAETQISYYEIHSKKMAEDLIKKGVVPNKSLKLIFPSNEIVPEELIHHFIRGYFDGDGCLTKNKKERYLSFTGTLDMLENIRQRLNINATVKKDKRSKSDIFSLQTGGNRKVLEIFDYLYKDATVFLERKKELFLKLKEEYNN